jgi:voltage-gated potassium channel
MSNIVARFATKVRKSKRWRQVRATWRDTVLLVREFIRPLLFFAFAIMGGGTFYHRLAILSNAEIGQETWSEAVYQVMGLAFLQPLGDNLPQDIRLQLFYFFMPIIGLIILAQGLTDFGTLFFNRRARSKEWEMAVASTFNQHIVLIGLGHLGFRVVKELYDLGQDISVIEMDPQDELITATKAMGVPVIQEDARRELALLSAGIERAKTLVLCTQNDSVNLQIGLKARTFNPSLRIVVRIFDDEFANLLQEQFGFHCMSATGMAAPKFAAAASGVDITRPITVEGEAFNLARFDIQPQSKLIGRTVSDIEQDYDVSVVLIRQAGASDFHPAGERTLQANDVIAIFGGFEQISRLVNSN